MSSICSENRKASREQGGKSIFLHEWLWMPLVLSYQLVLSPNKRKLKLCSKCESFCCSCPVIRAPIRITRNKDTRKNERQVPKMVQLRRFCAILVSIKTHYTFSAKEAILIAVSSITRFRSQKRRLLQKCQFHRRKRHTFNDHSSRILRKVVQYCDFTRNYANFEFKHIDHFNQKAETKKCTHTFISKQWNPCLQISVSSTFLQRC